MFNLFLISLTGLVTTYTDLSQRKIKNIHLLLVVLAAGTYYCFLVSQGRFTVTIPFILNLPVALIIGFFLYLSGLWRAGDAKLFLAYSLLLPVNRYASILPLSCLVLFLNTFLVAFLMILPFFLKTAIKNRGRLHKEVVSQKTAKLFLRIFLIMFCLSWIAQPLLQLCHVQENIFLGFILLYIGFALINRFIGKLKNRLLCLLIFALGLVLRFTFMPQSFTWPNTLTYLKILFVYTALLYIVRKAIDLEKQQQQRVPLAPFMFLGALLSNTGFLWLVIEGLMVLR